MLHLPQFYSLKNGTYRFSEQPVESVRARIVEADGAALRMFLRREPHAFIQ
jgi:hypothetical protein